MKGSVALVKMMSAVCVLLLAQGHSVLAQGGGSTEPTKTIIGDLLDVDRDFYIVRGERGEIQIEATHKTEITEEFGYGDRIKALVLMNNKAVKIERAGPDDVTGVTENVPVVAQAPEPQPGAKGEVSAPSAQPQQPESKTIVGDLLDVDRDFYIVRGERGEIQIEATHKTEITEEFGYGDRIKALVLMNNKAVKIERAGPDDVSGVTENVPVVAQAPEPQQGAKREAPTPSAQPKQPESKTIIGDLLDVDRDFYIVRSERGEIQIEATGKTEITEEFGYGDRIKAKVLMNNKALKIERAGPDDVPGVYEE
ncbi:MAG: hypothetical protein OXF97_05185 [Nitrospira sp.]|nr:hypothetical protein [Nitrospira sp.]